MDPFGLKGAAGGSPPVVGQDGAALWQHGLLQIVLRHGPFRLGKVGADALRRGLVKDELFTKRLGQHVLSQVGPSPPVVMMISARFLAIATASRAR